MELRHLKYFLVLAEQLSFRKASEKLFISQPPLSRQIKELEDEIGARLFERNNKRVVLTDAGKYFEQEAKQLIQSLEHAVLKTQKISNNVSGEFRIAYISSTFSGDISKLIKHLSKKFPYVTFRLYEVPTSKQVTALEQGKIDLGIIRAPLKSPKIKTRLWFKDSFSLVYNKKLLTLKSEKSIEALNNETFVFFNKDYAPDYYNTLLEICAKYGFTPKVVHESNNISSILQLVQNGLGASIVPTTAVKSNNHAEIESIELKSVTMFSEVLLATPKDGNSVITNAAIDFLLN